MTRLVVAAIAIGFSVVAYAAPDETATSNDYGNVGLLQTPTARFSGAGELRIGYASALPYNSPFISAQPFDWLEATFRYTKFSYKDVDGGPFVEDGYLDKSFDFKVGLLGESMYLPAIALGIQDIGGTGLLASEFIVASKRFGDWDLTLGLGWGRLGASGGLRNPLVSIDESFAIREGFGGAGRGDFGGKFEVDQLFSGERMDVFGGMRWAPEGSNWSFEIEREGNDYSQEPFNNDLTVDSSVNVGVGYETPGFGARVGWLRGNQFAFSLYFANDVSVRTPKPLDPPPTPVAPTNPLTTLEVSQRPESEDGDEGQRRAIRAALKRQDIQLLRTESAAVGPQQIVWIVQSRYRDEREVLDRVARTLSMLVDQRISRFQIVLVEGGLEKSRTDIDRKSVQRVASKGGVLGSGVSHRVPARISMEPVMEDPSLPSGLFDLDWFTGPRYRQSLGDPDQSYRAGLYWQLGVTKRWSPYLTMSARVEAEVVGNIDEIERQSDSVLPRVRSDIAEYNRQGKNGLRQLEFNYIRPITSEWSWRFSGGIFEEMYGGVAGEVLYRPLGGTWAIGANINRVRQREFDQRFDFQDYEVTTGHLTAYNEFPTWGVRTEVSVGCYLARDCGGTLIAARVFDNGAEFGVFATKTDVSSEEFGEGSFDKGFFVTLPFDLFLPRSSEAVATFSFRPLTRDGGQKVRDGRSLYE